MTNWLKGQKEKDGRKNKKERDFKSGQREDLCRRQSRKKRVEVGGSHEKVQQLFTDKL